MTRAGRSAGRSWSVPSPAGSAGFAGAWWRLAAAAWLCLACFAAVAAPPKAELWDRWSPHDENNPTVLNHGPWDAFLARYVTAGGDGQNRVHYEAVDGEDSARLVMYLSDLSRVPVTRLRRDEQRAFWINLYNAAVMKLVIDRFPLPSIQAIDISPGFFSHGPWGAVLVKVENENLSLDDIEHRVLRPIWADPRLHYALSTASIGGPNLAPRAYTAATADAMLDAAARAFVNHPRAMRVEGGKLRVSSLYRWYVSDFGGNDAGILAHLRQYATPERAAQIEGITKIAGDDYDWALNAAVMPEAAP